MESVSQGIKQRILAEIKRQAEKNGGIAPGQRVFEDETGITRSSWRGKYWATWTDAIVEAGFQPNFAPERLSEKHIVSFLADAVRSHKKFPSDAEMRIFRQKYPDAPAIVTIRKSFPTKDSMLDALIKFAMNESGYQDILSFLPSRTDTRTDVAMGSRNGWVYLLQSGLHYKIGRSENLERRVKQINIALPESVVLVHAIETDDTSGIEDYWHKRFARQRANGEWFKLGPIEVAAFKKRKFM